MKYIKSRKTFLSEAKIKDVVLGKQAQAVKKKWGEKYLDYEEVTPTEKIKQGRWKLDEADKNKVLSAFFSTSRKIDVEAARRAFASLPEKFAEIISQAAEGIESIDTSGMNANAAKGIERSKEVLAQFDIRNPSVDEMVAIFEPVFRKLEASTADTEKIQMQTVNGRQMPVMGEDGRPLKVAKPAGEPVFSKNRVGIKTMLEDYKKYCDPGMGQEAIDCLDRGDVMSIVSLVKDDVNGEYKTSFKIFDRDMYLTIQHNPKRILNMSISKYYSSCQHLYTGGERHRLLSNVFDPNSIPAFMEFDTPIYNGDEMISETMPLSRMMIRSIEGFDTDDKPVLFFDRSYPDRMKDGVYGDVFSEMVEKYSGNKKSDDVKRYAYMPDIEPGDTGIDRPYMDRLPIDQYYTIIGKNAKSLHITPTTDWSGVRVAKENGLRELTIESTELPENLLTTQMDLEWIKFKCIDIHDLSNFDKIKFEALGLDKCKIDNSQLIGFAMGKGLKRLSLVASRVEGLDLSGLDLEEIRLVYTAQGDLKSVLGTAKFKKLVVSDDLLQLPENKQCIADLKQNIAKDEQGRTIRDKDGKAVKINQLAPVIEVVGIGAKKKQAK